MDVLLVLGLWFHGPLRPALRIKSRERRTELLLLTLPFCVTGPTLTIVADWKVVSGT